MTKRNIY